MRSGVSRRPILEVWIPEGNLQLRPTHVRRARIPLLPHWELSDTPMKPFSKFKLIRRQGSVDYSVFAEVTRPETLIHESAERAGPMGPSERS